MLPSVTHVAQLSAAGFDLVHAFDAHAIAKAESGWAQLADGPRLGLLIGNTRALWPAFMAARASLAGEPHPLQAYTERTLARVFPAARIAYSHARYDGAFLPFQRLAIATGLGALAPSHLVIHPIYGPWFALRAAVAIEGDPPARTPIAVPCACEAGCRTALERAQADGTWQAWAGVREACSLRSHRYSDEQIAYHYTHAWRSVRE